MPPASAQHRTDEEFTSFADKLARNPDLEGLLLRRESKRLAIDHEPRTFRPDAYSITIGIVSWIVSWRVLAAVVGASDQKQLAVGDPLPARNTGRERHGGVLACPHVVRQRELADPAPRQVLRP